MFHPVKIHVDPSGLQGLVYLDRLQPLNQSHNFEVRKSKGPQALV